MKATTKLSKNALRMFFTFILFTCAINLSNAQWVQIGQDIDGEANQDESGVSISLSSDGKMIAIGAQKNDGNGDNSGHVRVYENIAGVWTQVGADIDGEALGDYSGRAVSMSGNGEMVAIGAIFNSGNGLNAGQVRVFELNAGTWIQVGADIDGESSGDLSGKPVSLSGDGSTLAIGAFANDGNGSNSGHVRIFKLNAGTWSQIGADIDGEAAGDLSGSSVSLSNDGKIVAIGAPGNTGNGSDAGHVRIYELNSGTWTQVGADIDGEAAGDFSGSSVSLSSDGTIVAIGAPSNNGVATRAGHVRVYKYNAGSWAQLGADIDGAGFKDGAGTSVCISSNGQIVAIGSPELNTNNKGEVRVFQFIAGVWTQIGADIHGRAAGDHSGISVSLSSDGQIVASGAIMNGGKGYVTVHSFGNVSIIENGFDNNLLVYPNPFTSNFIVDLGAEYQSINITISDLYGRLLFSTDYSKTQKVNLELNEPTGIYLVSIKADKNNAVLRLIKE